MKARIQQVLQNLMLVPVLALGIGVMAPALALSLGVAAPTQVSAVDCENPLEDPLESGAGCSQGAGTATDLFGEDGIFRMITNILLFLVGAISVIMLIIGGIRYVVSGGDQNAVTSAKNTILYAIVGIVVAFLAYALVNFVLSSLGGGIEQ